VVQGGVLQGRQFERGLLGLRHAERHGPTAVNSGADWNSQNGNVTTVGTNGGSSFYGAFDLNGNLREWNDLTGAAGASRGLRGGGWVNNAFTVSSSGRTTTFNLSFETDGNGFRLASPVAVPEPSTLAMLAAGLACGGYGFIRRRRMHRSGPNISPRPQISRRRSAGHR